MSETLAGRRRLQRNFWQELKGFDGATILIIYVAFLVACFVASAIEPEDFVFASQGNLSILAQQIPITAIAAIGIGLLMISGEFDISVAGTFTLVAYVVAILFGDFGWALPLALAAGLATALAVGAVNGFVTLWLGLPSFIATIGMIFFLRGVIRFVSLSPETNQPLSHSFFPGDGLENLLGGTIAGPLRAEVIWLIVFSVAGYVLLNRHRIGNQMFAAGGNADAAKSVGVNVRRIKLIAFMICALAAGISGLLQLTRINEVEPQFATVSGFELKVIAAVVVGGVSLFGGRGTIIGMVVGAALIETVDNVLILVGAPETVFKGLVGALIITSVVLNQLMRRRPTS